MESARPVDTGRRGVCDAAAASRLAPSRRPPLGSLRAPRRFLPSVNPRMWPRASTRRGACGSPKARSTAARDDPVDVGSGSGRGLTANCANPRESKRAKWHRRGPSIRAGERRATGRLQANLPRPSPTPRVAARPLPIPASGQSSRRTERSRGGASGRPKARSAASRGDAVGAAARGSGGRGRLACTGRMPLAPCPVIRPDRPRNRPSDHSRRFA